MGMLPMPLPISSIAEERRAALGKRNIRAAHGTNLDETDRHRFLPALAPAMITLSALSPHR